MKTGARNNWAGSTLRYAAVGAGIAGFGGLVAMGPVLQGLEGRPESAITPEQGLGFRYAWDMRRMGQTWPVIPGAAAAGAGAGALLGGTMGRFIGKAGKFGLAGAGAGAAIGGLVGLGVAAPSGVAYSTAIGAGGVLAGGIIGKIAGKGKTGALIGGLTGALLGGVIGTTKGVRAVSRAAPTGSPVLTGGYYMGGSTMQRLQQMASTRQQIARLQRPIQGGGW